MDKKTGRPYPPTAQHAVREAKIVAENIASDLKKNSPKKKFCYDSMGSMAKIGKRNGVALLMGIRLRGFLAWVIWRQYYLSTLPLLLHAGLKKGHEPARFFIQYYWTIT